MPKTRKNSNKKKSRKTRKAKIYGSDRFYPYAFHKITQVSFNPYKSCETIKKIFGNVIGKIHQPPDSALDKRDIKWIRFSVGGKAELHYVKPFKITKQRKMLLKLAKEQDINHPLKTEMFENHAGLYIPDLTPVMLKVLKLKIPYIMDQREDGLYQLYIDVPAALDFLEIDSIKFDFEKVHKKYPFFRIFNFSENSELVKKLMRDNNDKVFNYIDPRHNGAPRTVLIKNDKITITGIDKPNGKVWKIIGKIDKKGNTVLNFSGHAHGGPKKVKGNINKYRAKFSDGNIWKLDTSKLYNMG